MFAALGFVIVFGTMAGFSLYMTGVKLIGSVKASLYACMEPGILHDPYGTVDESKIYNTGSDRNVICYCNDYYSGNPDKEKTPETLTGGNRQ